MKKCIRCKEEKEDEYFSKNYSICKECDKSPAYSFSREHKVCTLCGEEKSIDSFSKRTAAPDGHAARCRECRKTKAKKIEDPIKVLVKICPSCQELKDAEMFYRNTYSRDHLQGQCIPCKNASAKRSRERNIGKIPKTRKVCPRCKESTIDFSKNRLRPDGLEVYCVKCTRLRRQDKKDKLIKVSESLCKSRDGIWLYLVRKDNLIKVGMSDCPIQREGELVVDFGPCRMFAIARPALKASILEARIHQSLRRFRAEVCHKNGDLSHEWYEMPWHEMQKYLKDIEELVFLD